MWQLHMWFHKDNPAYHQPGLDLPGNNMLYSNGAKGTDLLITWLYKLSLGVDRDYKLASVIGILVFIISATFSLVVYNKSSAVKGEDNFQ